MKFKLNEDNSIPSQQAIKSIEEAKLMLTEIKNNVASFIASFDLWSDNWAEGFTEDFILDMRQILQDLNFEVENLKATEEEFYRDGNINDLQRYLEYRLNRGCKKINQKMKKYQLMDASDISYSDDDWSEFQ